ncbi:MAG: hypothetical protein ACOYNL_05965 [Rickettsiales bacterium]
MKDKKIMNREVQADTEDGRSRSAAPTEKESRERYKNPVLQDFIQHNLSDTASSSVLVNSDPKKVIDAIKGEQCDVNDLVGALLLSPAPAAPTAPPKISAERVGRGRAPYISGSGDKFATAKGQLFDVCTTGAPECAPKTPPTEKINKSGLSCADM